MTKGYKKITFNELLNYNDRTYIFYLLNRILKNQSKYTEWIGKWTKTGISKELFNYSANDYYFEYNLINASMNDLELLMYRFIYKNSPQLNKLRSEEFEKEFKNKYIYLKTDNDFISSDIIGKIKALNGKKIINNRDDEVYFFEDITLFPTGIHFIFDYRIAYESVDGKYNGHHCGKQLGQKTNEKLSDFIKRGYEWLILLSNFS